ncbi:hypothetical protein WJX72_009779 [[Myrmecia] bisecta]|uniref:Uncharacterized protein n=1 Tax=[Myrmecia] bisecta TaxID=41462 RepID=A0AAW1PLS5_9CHLO
MDTSNGCDVTKLREELAATRKALRKAQACSMMEAKRLLLTLEAQSRKLKRADHDQEYLQHQVLQLQSQLSRQEAVYADRTSQTVRVLYCWFLCTLSGKDRQADQLRADAVAARRGLMQHAKYHRDHFKRRTDEYKRLFDEEVATNNAAHEAAIEEHTGASEALRRQLTELHDSHAQLQRERKCAHELVVQGVKNSEIPILCPTCKLPESACAMCERKRNEPQGSRSGPHNWCCSLDADVRRLLNEEEEHQSGSRPRHRNGTLS